VYIILLFSPLALILSFRHSLAVSTPWRPLPTSIAFARSLVFVCYLAFVVARRVSWVFRRYYCFNNNSNNDNHRRLPRWYTTRPLHGTPLPKSPFRKFLRRARQQARLPHSTSAAVAAHLCRTRCRTPRRVSLLFFRTLVVPFRVYYIIILWYYRYRVYLWVSTVVFKLPKIF